MRAIEPRYPTVCSRVGASRRTQRDASAHSAPIVDAAPRRHEAGGAASACGQNGVAVPPHGIYSQDIDHSGGFNPADILRVIDLLNGADAFVVWNGTPRPSSTGRPKPAT